MLCPSCSAAAIDAYGRCPNCGFQAGPPAPAQPYAAYLPPPVLVTPTAPAGLGMAAQVLIAISGVFSLILFGLNIWSFSVAKAAYDAGFNSDAVDQAAAASGLVLILAVLLNIATGVVFMIWFYKSATLSAVLAPGRQALSAGWAIGGWFIPLAFLVLPRIVAGGIWRAARPLGPDLGGTRPRTYLVTWWWLTFAFGQFFLSARVMANRNPADASSVSSLTVPFTLAALVNLSWIAATVLGIVMIRKITSMQQVRILQGPGVGHPYAAPVPAQIPYAAYVDPAAPYAGAPAGPYYAAPQPMAGQPYAPTAAWPGAQPQPVQAPQAPLIPSQLAAPVAEPAPAAPPADAAPVAFTKESAEAERPTVPHQATAPSPESETVAAPELRAEPATLVEPQDAVPGDAATVVFEKREG